MAILEDSGEDTGDPHALGRVDVSLANDISVIVLVGEVDMALTETLEAARDQVIDRDVPVRIDASGLTFIDSSGLAFLTRLNQASPGDQRPKLAGASPLILETIKIVGLAEVVDLDSDAPPTV
jgi:anti-sigma B factor antagonist